MCNHFISKEMCHSSASFGALPLPAHSTRVKITVRWLESLINYGLCGRKLLTSHFISTTKKKGR